MTITFVQTLYRIQTPSNKHAIPLGLEHEIKKVLEEGDEYPHIIKYREYQGDYGHSKTDETYLFFERNHAYAVMQSVMRNLGLLEEWSPEDLQECPDGESGDLEIDEEETPEEEQWKVVSERLFIQAQEA